MLTDLPAARRDASTADAVGDAQKADAAVVAWQLLRFAQRACHVLEQKHTPLRLQLPAGHTRAAGWMAVLLQATAQHAPAAAMLTG
jgi:hypothetical protein